MRRGHKPASDRILGTDVKDDLNLPRRIEVDANEST